MDLMDKRVLVIGLGKSGQAAAHLLRDKGARVTAVDAAANDTVRAIAAELRRRRIEVCFGVLEWEDFAFDLAVVSPGVDPRQPMIQALRARGVPLIGELELGFQHCPCPIIAITGTNGKTTTTELVERILRAGGKRAKAVGNIGWPICDAVRRSQTFDVLAAEVSSFQLETIRTFHPQTAILLNITPDHLDRYENLLEYALAKVRIFENQRREDFAILNKATLPLLSELGVQLAARLILFSDCGGRADYTYRDGAIWRGREKLLSLSDTHLRGPHNAQNLMAALAVAEIFDVPRDAARRVLCEYRPLPHRCEFVATIRGVDYINDSKATNPDALAKALEGMTRPVVLIAGGRDKGFDFYGLRSLLQGRVRRAILLGEAAAKLLQCWGNVVECQKVASLPAAVRAAQTAAQEGDCVLLSPACASFDMFENFEDRGERFKKIVRQLANSPTAPRGPSKPKKGSPS